MFKKTKIKGNTSRSKNGEFATSDYKITKRRKRLGIVLIVELSILIALGICLADLTAQRVSEALYPIPVVEALEVNFEPSMTIAEHICAATDGQNCDVLVNLAKCESSLNPDAYHINNNKTVDLGLFQINSVHYKKDNMSAVCALDVYCSARWSNEQIKNGNLHIWVCADKI